MALNMGMFQSEHPLICMIIFLLVSDKNQKGCKNESQSLI